MPTLPEGHPKYAEIARVYSKRLNDRTIPHPPAFIIFSAIPGSGKTTLARKLAADLQAQYINHDEMRVIVRELGWDLNDFYIPYASKALNDDIIEHDKNRLIILDASLDRNPQMYYDGVKKYNATPLVIRLQVPLPVIRERLLQRDGLNGAILKDIDRYTREFEHSATHVPAHITLGETYDYPEVLARVREALSR